MTATYVTFFVYLFVLLIIGLITYRMTSTLSDYVLGGRKLNSWVAALSAQASDMSGWLLLGLPGAAYASGIRLTCYELSPLFLFLYSSSFIRLPD